MRPEMRPERLLYPVSSMPCSRTCSVLIFTGTVLSLMPSLAFALTLGEAGEALSITLYGLIGFFGALSLITFVSGFIFYVIHIGIERRTYGIHGMEWGVALLFAVLSLIVVLGLIE